MDADVDAAFVELTEPKQSYKYITANFEEHHEGKVLLTTKAHNKVI